MSFKNKEKETVSSKVLRQEAGVWGVVLWRKRATTAASGGNVGFGVEGEAISRSKHFLV